MYSVVDLLPQNFWRSSGFLGLKPIALSLVFSMGIAGVAHAQKVKSFSVDTELKRLVQACSSYARVGKTDMADLSKYGYKTSKLGLVGGHYVSSIYLDSKSVDYKSLKRGDGYSASLNWSTAMGHSCEVSVTVKLFHEPDLARAIEAKVGRTLKSAGFAAQRGRDAKGREQTVYVKGKDRLTFYSSISYLQDNANGLKFSISNQNNEARKN